MPALLRADTRLWTPGQVKPTGIPSIDWTHPLASGLEFYGFDVAGVIVDLVGARPPNPVPGATVAGPGASPWGTGLLYNNSAGQFLASDARIRAVTATGVYSFAAACVLTATAAVTQGIFGRTANNGTSAPFNNWLFKVTSSGTSFTNGINSGGVNTIVGSGFAGALNTLTSLALSVSGAGANFFANGKSAGGTAGLAPQSLNTSDAIIFGGNSSAAPSAPFNGLVFYGAFWSRALSAQEALLLHLDPYCFLLPPEGEMPTLFGTIFVSVAARMALGARTQNARAAGAALSARMDAAARAQVPPAAAAAPTLAMRTNTVTRPGAAAMSEQSVAVRVATRSPAGSFALAPRAVGIRGAARHVVASFAAATRPITIRSGAHSAAPPRARASASLRWLAGLAARFGLPGLAQILARVSGADSAVYAAGASDAAVYAVGGSDEAVTDVGASDQ